VRAFDPGAIHDGADMSKVEQIEAMVRRCEAELGSCDILVNNAGIQHVAPIESFPVERWDAIIAINLSATFHAMRVALPGMQKRNWGRIINVASAHGLVASAQKSAYVAAKHGVVGLTKVAALENATTGVTVNAICPGWVLTPLVQHPLHLRRRPVASQYQRLQGGLPLGDHAEHRPAGETGCALHPCLCGDLVHAFACDATHRASTLRNRIDAFDGALSQRDP
jgi:NAD(P)-dependent dehydrogenase (short-subunit alcohol dehydrogenase family)